MSSYVQVDRSSVEAAVPEQHLDGLQIGSGLQQMSGKTVTQHMGTDPFGQSSPASCLLTDSLKLPHFCGQFTAFESSHI